MREKLKPCPFCGGNKLTVSRYFGLNCYTVRCINEDCGMKVVTDFAKTKKEAIELWNTRPNPWHTGTPTEEGWYLLHLRRKDKPYCVAYMDGHHWLGIDDFYIFVDDVLAWQKIEPYRG